MTHRLDILSPHAQTFLETVRGRLGDLPASTQEDLIDQVEQRLHDLDNDEHPDGVAAALGEAKTLADDLRVAAGFGPAPATERPTAAAPASLDGLRALANHRTIRPTVDYLLSLRPAWWALRGYVLVAGVLAAISQGGGYRLHTIGSYIQATQDTAPIHLSVAWLAIPIAAVIASIVVGRTTPRLPPPARLLVAAVNILAIVLLLAYPTWWLAPAFAYYTGLVS